MEIHDTLYALSETEWALWENTPNIAAFSFFFRRETLQPPHNIEHLSWVRRDAFLLYYTHYDDLLYIFPRHCHCRWGNLYDYIFKRDRRCHSFLNIEKKLHMSLYKGFLSKGRLSFFITIYWYIEIYYIRIEMRERSHAFMPSPLIFMRWARERCCFLHAAFL